MSDRFSKVVSVALSPLLMPAVVALLVLLDIGSGPAEIVTTVSVAFVSLFAVPLADILWMVRRGKTPTPDVPNREARTEPFVIAVISGSAAVLAIRAMGMHGEPIIHAILVAYVINMILVMGINAAWKISVHMAGLGGSIAILLIVSGLSGDNSPVLTGSTVIPLLLLIPIVGWARYRLNAHTMAQIVVGAIVGFGGHWLALLAQVGR
ncbi:MAG: hypothetical protein ACC655_04700 [Rhodothermia bacterium]